MNADFVDDHLANGENPICDLELVVARCLRQAIFGGKLTAHPDPHAEIVKQQELGRLPRNMRGRSHIGANASIAAQHRKTTTT